MRLTLRTLLAWLDDTLPPAEVRQIGQQVNESPFAKELVERINRVTRQRRLTVPPNQGADGSDPNLVASYLDNELTPEQVAEYEKKCLTADVHLAEAASCHQILSLIGQKAKVPPEARQRMYHLVKGRETVHELEPARLAATARKARPEPLTAPVPPWKPPETPRRSWAERFGPVAAVAALILLLSWATWSNLSPAPTPNDAGPPLLARGPEPVVPPTAKAAAPELAPKDARPAVEDDGAAPEAGPEPEKVAANPPAAEPEAAPKEADPSTSKEAASKEAARPAELPLGAIGVVDQQEGLVLRYKAETRTWEHLDPQATLRAGDRVVGLAPFRNAIRIGNTRLVLVGDSEVQLRPAERGTAAGFDLVLGRVLLIGATPPGPVAVDFARRALAISPPSGVAVGLERINHRPPGVEVPAPPTIRIYVPEGEVGVASNTTRETLAGPITAEFLTTGRFEKSSGAFPSWVNEPAASALEQETGRQFARLFKSDRAPITSLVEAMESDQKEIRQYAVAALGAIGEVELVANALSTKNDPITRRAAIRVLRDIATRDAPSAQKLRDQLATLGGKPWAEVVEKLLVGYSSREAREERTYKDLFEMLNNKDVGVRELAIETLMALTDRADPLGYDPDKPTPEAVEAWKDLLKRGEIKVDAAAKER